MIKTKYFVQKIIIYIYNDIKYYIIKFWSSSSIKTEHGWAIEVRDKQSLIYWFYWASSVPE